MSQILKKILFFNSFSLTIFLVAKKLVKLQCYENHSRTPKKPFPYPQNHSRTPKNHSRTPKTISIPPNQDITNFFYLSGLLMASLGNEKFYNLHKLKEVY